MAAGVITIQDAFDFNCAVTMKTLPPILVEGDENAHRIDITCRESGAPADLSGLTCAGYIVNSDRKSFLLEGSINGSVASVPLHHAAYTASGPVVIMVKLYKAGLTTTIYQAHTMVITGATEEIYDPDGLLPGVEELMAQADAYETALNGLITNAAAATAAANTAAANAAPVMSNFLAGEDLNYNWIAWGAENLTIDSGTGEAEIPSSGEWRKSINQIPIEYGEYLYFGGGAYPSVRVYDASDDSYLGHLVSGYSCPYTAASMYMLFTAQYTALPARVTRRQSKRQANLEEYVFYDRNKQAIPLREDATGIRVGEPRPADEWDALTLGGGNDPSFGLNLTSYSMTMALARNKTYFFFRYAAETGADVFITNLQLIWGSGNDAWQAVKNEGNCLLAQWVGEDVAAAEHSLYCYLYSIKDGSGVDYEGGFRVDQIVAFESELPYALIFDVLAYGKNSLRYLLQRALPDGVWKSELPDVYTAVSRKADTLALPYGYTGVPFGAEDWEQGTIYTNGSFVSSASRIRLATFINGNADRIHAKYGYLINTVFKYDADGNLISYESVSGQEFYGFEEGYQYRLTVKKTDGSDIDVSEYVNILLLSGGLYPVKSSYQEDGKRMYFQVSVNQGFDDCEATAAAAQDSESFADVDCVIKLPSTYTFYGQPTKLAFFAHGSEGGVSEAGWAAGGLAYAGDLLQNGYAVFDVQGSNNESHINMGSPRTLQAIHKAYRYIQEHFNVEPLLYAAGFSMGGTTAINFANAFPELVKVLGVFAPRVNFDTITIGGTDYEGTWDDPGNAGYFEAEYNFDDGLVWEPDKVTGFNPYMERTFTNASGERCTIFPVPVKIWHGGADTVNEYQLTQEYAAQIRRGGGNCHYRLIAGLGHSVPDYAKTELLYWFNRFH